MKEVNSTWSERFKFFKKECAKLDILDNGGKFGNKELAELTGMKEASIRNQTQPNKPELFPYRLKVIVTMFEEDGIIEACEKAKSKAKTNLKKIRKDQSAYAKPLSETEEHQDIGEVGRNLEFGGPED